MATDRMATEGQRTPELTTSVEPSRRNQSASPGGNADVAVKDALIILAVCWMIVLGIGFSLRNYSR